MMVIVMCLAENEQQTFGRTDFCESFIEYFLVSQLCFATFVKYLLWDSDEKR